MAREPGTRNREGGRRSSLRTFAALAFAATLAACAREGNAQAAGAASAIVRDDTASVVRLLRSVRGSDPVLCELATRSVDMDGWWSRWADMGGNPLEVDSASAALIVWIQRSHNDPAVVPHLRAALRDTDACVRRVAGSFLGRVEHPNAIAALVGALEDPNADTRNVAVIGLGLSDKPAPSLVEPLLRRLRDESPLVRRSAAWALGSLEATGAMEQLIEALQRDADPRVRQAAAWALGQISG